MESSAGAARSSDRMQMSISGVKLDKLGGGGGACPKSLKTPGLEDLNSAECGLFL